MPELSITEPQREQLEAVRADVEDAFVDTYGHTTVEDALDYLLDTYTPPNEQERAAGGPYDRIASAEYPELQQIASTVDDIPGSGIGADEMRGKLLTTLGPGELARRLDGVDVEDEDGTTGSDEGIIGSESDGESRAQASVEAEADTAEGNEDGDAGTDGSEATTADPTTEADDDDDDAAEAADGEDDADEADDGPGGGSDGPGGVLAAANRLLREHDDKWRKSETSEEPYEVDLPDGTTTGVRTKDDVRQLLFRHY